MRWLPRWLAGERPAPAGPVRLASPTKIVVRRRSGLLRPAMDGWRVTAVVDGRPAWFESSDVELSPALEAIGSAFLLPALSQGRRLEISGPVCPQWLANQSQVVELLAQWWNYPRLVPQLTAEDRPARQWTSPAPSHRPVLCFTGGVDSFYSLLRHADRAQALLYVWGYDVDIRDARLARSTVAAIRQIAGEVAIPLILLATNLRRHRTFRAENWERTHGGALAALAHLLEDQFDSLQISASESREGAQPWGSRWDLDCLHSSARVRVTQVGEDLMRAEKLWEIAGEPLVQQHLRVCWQRHRSAVNCGQCEKCLRTMLILESGGQLAHFATFRGAGDLRTLVDRMPQLPHWVLRTYDKILAHGLPSDLDGAVRRLIARSPSTND